MSENLNRDQFAPVIDIFTRKPVEQKPAPKPKLPDYSEVLAAWYDNPVGPTPNWRDYIK